MGDATIGIKIADGTYFPIMDENSTKRRKLILTTVKDGQTSVQIDLYRGQDSDISRSSYIGSLMIDNIQPAAKGDPDIELIVGIDQAGNLSAKAGDLSTGESRSLNVSLESLTDEAKYDIPDFELDDSYVPEEEEVEDFSPDEPAGESRDTVVREDDFEEEESEEVERPRRHPVLLAAFIIVGLAIIALAVLLVFRVCQQPTARLLSGAPAEETVVDNPPAQEITEPAPAETAEEEEATSEAAAEPAKPAETAPAVTASEGGVWYWIRWGDTLWDISISFYRTPWLYGRIARENNIRNPDLIYAGTRIYIPKK